MRLTNTPYITFTLLQLTAAAPFLNHVRDAFNNAEERVIAPKAVGKATINLYNSFQNATHAVVRGYVYVAKQKSILKSADPFGAITIATSDRISNVTFSNSMFKVTTNERGMLMAYVPKQSASLVDMKYQFAKTSIKKFTDVEEYGSFDLNGDAQFTTWNVADSSGWFIISDVDDTVKQTGVLDKKKMMWNIVRNKPAVPVVGIADTYAKIYQELSQPPMFFVSAGPWQMKQQMQAFLGSIFPNNYELWMKDLNKFSEFFSNAMQYKLTRITPIIERFSKGKYLFIGDSGEQDPETYSASARLLLGYNPKAVYCIWIRKVVGYNKKKEAVQNDPARFTRAWANNNIPVDRTYIFSDASELDKIDVAGGKCQPLT